MPLIRALVSWGPPAYEVADRLSNTLYFNVSVIDPTAPVDYDALGEDIMEVYDGMGFCNGAKIEVRIYDMADEKPRPERAYWTITSTGTWATVANQVAIALSYYGDRNLPRQRGRIFTGPHLANNSYVDTAYIPSLLDMASALAGIGGINVDWSVYSPTSNTHHAITNVWVDNSWDIIRSRKLPATSRQTRSLNG